MVMNVFARKDALLFVLVVVIGAVNAVASACVAILLQQVLDIAVSGDRAGFARVLMVAVVYMVVLAAFSFAEVLCGKWCLRNVTRRLRERVFRGVMRKRPQAFEAENSSAYLSAVVNDVKLIEDNMLLPLLECSQVVAMFLATLVLLLWLSPLVTAILAGFLLLMLLVPTLLGGALEKRQAQYSAALAQFTALTQDFLNGYNVIRSFAVGRIFARRFQAENRAAAEAKFRADRLLAVNETVAQWLSLASSVVIVFVAAWLVIEGRITVGTLLALIQLSSSFSMPVLLLLQDVPKIQSVRPVLEKLRTLASDDRDWEPETAEETATLNEALTVHGLCYSYQPETPVLRGVDLTLRKGEKIVLVGTSGSGKSTLIKLLMGYSLDYDGSIAYDARDSRSFSRQAFSQVVAVLQQNVTLFDGSVRDNITLGDVFSEQALTAALAESGVAAFLADLLEGLETAVGENGSRLSGGQRQRVALARALIRETPLLILDEGTSAVDQQTAWEIEQSLLDDPERTMLVITHHLSPTLARRYDAVLEMKAGMLMQNAKY